jgi:hypothetical protein
MQPTAGAARDLGQRSGMNPEAVSGTLLVRHAGERLQAGV